MISRLRSFSKARVSIVRTKGQKRFFAGSDKLQGRMDLRSSKKKFFKFIGMSFLGTISMYAYTNYVKTKIDLHYAPTNFNQFVISQI